MLTKKLDRVFSLYIRARDTYATRGKSGVCCTCGETKEYSKLQCGHFISRRCMSTRWDEQNCNAQCASCNMFQAGRQFEHGVYIDRKYGEGTAMAILEKSKTILKLHTTDLQDLIKLYNAKLEALQKI